MVAEEQALLDPNPARAHAVMEAEDACPHHGLARHEGCATVPRGIAASAVARLLLLGMKECSGRLKRKGGSSGMVSTTHIMGLCCFQSPLSVPQWRSGTDAIYFSSQRKRMQANQLHWRNDFHKRHSAWEIGDTGIGATPDHRGDRLSRGPYVPCRKHAARDPFCPAQRSHANSIFPLEHPEAYALPGGMRLHLDASSQAYHWATRGLEGCARGWRTN